MTGDIENELLFHCTDKFDTLKSIIQNGFYPSYAKEIFAKREQKILMVSYSFMPIKESIKHEAYGIYKIGVNPKWARANNIHPVHYTFEGSFFENSVVDLIEIATAGQVLKDMISMYQAGGAIEAKGKFLEKFKHIATSGVSLAQADKICDVNNSVGMAAFTILFFAKNYEVQLPNGKSHIAFFDREWRYIPRDGIDGYPLLLLKESFGKENADYQYWEKQPKPHGKNIPLKIGIEDIQYIVVNQEKELVLLRTFLEEQFDKDKIDDLLGRKRLQLATFE